MKKTRKNLLRCEKGVAYIEFMICLPVLVLLFLGAFEVARYVQIIQKLEKTVDEVTDVIAQTDPNASGTLQANLGAITSGVLSTMQPMMSPYTFNANNVGMVMVSDISCNFAAGCPTGGNAVVNWQACGCGATSSSPCATSNISAISKPRTGAAAIGKTANLPAAFTMNEGEETIIGELYYQFSPVTTQTLLGNVTIYRTAFYTPRLGSLAAYSSTCP